MDRHIASELETSYPRWRTFLTYNVSTRDAATTEHASPLSRLAGALAFVRQGVVRKEPEPHDDPSSDAAPQVEIREVGGQHQLEFLIEDPQLGEVLCRLRNTEQGLRAELVAHDTQTERLFQAEAGRLRVQLEERGLRVAGIDITRP